jgi:hypothetical protein
VLYLIHSSWLVQDVLKVIVGSAKNLDELNFVYVQRIWFSSMVTWYNIIR